MQSRPDALAAARSGLHRPGGAADVSTDTTMDDEAPLISEPAGIVECDPPVPETGVAPIRAQPARPRVAVVMPAYNAERTLEETLSYVPRDVVDEILLVDDKSSDNTVEVARRLDIRVISHPHNVGYGGNRSE